MTSWAMDVSGTGLTEATLAASMGDARRATRLRAVVTAIAARAEATLPQIFPVLRELKAAYAFFSNRALSPSQILGAERPATLQRLAQEATILLVQDTTSLAYRGRPGTRGLGPIGARADEDGLELHTTLAVTTGGVSQGLVALERWERAVAAHGQRETRRARPLAAKERARWLRNEAASLAGLPAHVQAVTIADREADLFALFAASRPANAALLIRAAQNRCVTVDGGERQRLFAAVAAAPVLGCHMVPVGRQRGRPPREALCRLRVCAVALQPPVNQPKGTPPQAPVTVRAVQLEEVGAPDGGEPLCWLLLTTLAIPDLETAVTLLAWYSLRWLIERYHFILKTGCAVEALQLREADRLERAVAVYCLVAWRVLALTHQARVTPDAPCDTVLRAPEWQTLSCLRQGTPTPPATPPTLAEAVRWIAQLGGFLGRPADGDPGPLTLWRGFVRLQDFVHARTLFARAL